MLFHYKCIKKERKKSLLFYFNTGKCLRVFDWIIIAVFILFRLATVLLSLTDGG